MLLYLLLLYLLLLYLLLPLLLLLGFPLLQLELLGLLHQLPVLLCQLLLNLLLLVLKLLLVVLKLLLLVLILLMLLQILLALLLWRRNLSLQCNRNQPARECYAIVGIFAKHVRVLVPLLTPTLPRCRSRLVKGQSKQDVSDRISMNPQNSVVRYPVVKSTLPCCAAV
jgi:hypothetical protein